MTLTPRRILVAGATGAVGRTVARLAAERGIDVVLQVRPRPDREPVDPRVALVDLADTAALTSVLGGCTTILQLIGTRRSRFAAGDTYQTSDVGTTRQLVEAARRAGTIDHLVLLSSVGAGKPLGAYLRAKAEAESIVRSSGLAWTILRPSQFVGEGHTAPRGAGALTRLPGLRRFRPIQVETLAATLLHVALTRVPLSVALEGASLWEVVGDAQAVP